MSMLSIKDRLTPLDKKCGRGTRTNTDGMRMILRMNAIRIPNDKRAPISLALGRE